MCASSTEDQQHNQRELHRMLSQRTFLSVSVSLLTMCVCYLTVGCGVDKWGSFVNGRKKIFSPLKTSTQTVGTNQPLVQRVSLFVGEVEWPEHDADYSYLVPRLITI